MKKNVRMFAALLAMLAIAACGNGNSGEYSGLFGDFFNELYSPADTDAKDKFYQERNDKLRDNPIPLEIDADVPLLTNGVNRVENPLNFYCDAQITRGGVYQMGNCWAEPATEDEKYNFNGRFALVMLGEDGNAIYSVPLSISGLEKCSYNKLVVNPAGTEVELNFAVDFKPFYAQKLSAVRSLRVVDRTANAAILDELAKTVQAEEREYDNNQTTK